jgi:hypothetical protein
MKVYEIPIKKLSPGGTVITINTVVLPTPDNKALFTFFHDSILIGTILCPVGDTGIFKATDFVIQEYFKSDEFEAFIRKGGIWN